MYAPEHRALTLVPTTTRSATHARRVTPMITTRFNGGAVRALMMEARCARYRRPTYGQELDGLTTRTTPPGLWLVKTPARVYLRSNRAALSGDHDPYPYIVEPEQTSLDGGTAAVGGEEFLVFLTLEGGALTELAAGDDLMIRFDPSGAQVDVIALHTVDRTTTARRRHFPDPDDPVWASTR
jgi:hypothetical protein